MGKTMADVLRDQGHVEGRVQNARETLVRLLRRRFGEVPEHTIAVIESTADLETLRGWLDLVVTVETLDEIGIGGPPGPRWRARQRQAAPRRKLIADG